MSKRNQKHQSMNRNTIIEKKSGNYLRTAANVLDHLNKKNRRIAKHLQKIFV